MVDGDRLVVAGTVVGTELGSADGSLEALGATEDEDAPAVVGVPLAAGAMLSEPALASTRLVVMRVEAELPGGSAIAVANPAVLAPTASATRTALAKSREPRRLMVRQPTTNG
ncbi:MAG: hypothetical protein M3548_04450 [Actinomycetota bacterium]|nr:hypothetical protein [Actinomycetota bacterium]